MEHIPVMIEEVLQYLAPGEGKVILDLNLGPGGHAREILQRFRDIFLIGVDLDEDALESAEENLMEFPNKILIRENFKNIPTIMEKAGVEKVDGILSDLGLSSLQLSRSEEHTSELQSH